jgi:ABC-type phosphate transport system substrate-binding protein
MKRAVLLVWFAVAALAFVGIGAMAHGARADGAPAFVVIVNPSNPIPAVERKFLEDAFLKKITRWPDDKIIRPVDLPPNSPVRRRFTDYVLKRSIEAVRGYWQQRIFSGRDVPPVELDNEGDVVKYVVRNDGAVGYVSPDTSLEGVKVLSVR